MAKKFVNYEFFGGKWYGVDKYGITFSVKSPPKSFFAKKGGGSNYRVGAGHGGYVTLSENYKHSFSKDVFEKKSRGGLRVSEKYTGPYKGKGFGYKNPFSALNTKINGAQKYYTQKTFEKRDKLGRLKTSALNITWLRKHLTDVIEKIEINSMNFTVILSLRAQKIFQDSFKHKKFYSANGGVWEPLSSATIKKRQRKNTWPGAGGMLREYGDMIKSIKVRRELGNNAKYIGGVYTDPSEYKEHQYYSKKRGGMINDKRGVFCYAGLHNNGGVIKNGHRLPKRQFIGHSTYLFDFALKQVDRYLFFNVFN